MATTTGLGAQSAAAGTTGYAGFYSTGTLVVYGGTPPANAKAALSSNTVLATHTLAGFTESNGTISASAIASATISADGTATFMRILISAVSEYQSIVGSEITITPDANYLAGGTSNVTSVTMTVPSA
jgi:hypothetical protein